ncbi:MAG: ABC transporter permease, partial [Candidatus Eremiobacteraeota bacterium]|nr:ABC transporter permease [Candidatus Eremiobacteraeota bacterium]
MKMLDVIRLAFRALTRNSMRTLLTMLGMIIGVAAVITMLALGNGAKASVQASIASLGTNTLMISSGSVNRGGVRSGAFGSESLTVEDAEALRQEASALMAVAPLTQNSSQLVYGNKNWNSSISGTNSDFMIARNWELDRGRFFSERELRVSAKVCVLGSSVVENLFEGEDPIGKTIRIGSVPCEVIGVLKTKGESGFGQNQDDTVLVPYTTAMKRMFSLTSLRTILVSAKDEDSTTQAEQQITEILKRRHRIAEGAESDFTVRSQAEFAERAAESSQVFTALLAGIASVSLLVGGIGIMNIMLVSVTERIKEIGIRLAVGAKKRDIRSQFLVESIVMSVTGGGIGVLLALATAQAAARYSQWPMLVEPSSVVLAFTFSAAVGVFFGYYPAVKASRLDPIQA